MIRNRRRKPDRTRNAAASDAGKRDAARTGAAKIDGAKTDAARIDAGKRRASLKYPLASGEAAPGDMAVFRYALARRVETLAGTPLRCREPACRRSKSCMGPDLRCLRDFPSKPATGEEQARVMAQVQQLIKAELARRDVAGDG